MTSSKVNTFTPLTVSNISELESVVQDSLHSYLHLSVHFPSYLITFIIIVPLYYFAQIPMTDLSPTGDVEQG